MRWRNLSLRVVLMEKGKLMQLRPNEAKGAVAHVLLLLASTFLFTTVAFGQTVGEQKEIDAWCIAVVQAGKKIAPQLIDVEKLSTAKQTSAEMRARMQFSLREYRELQATMEKEVCSAKSAAYAEVISHVYEAQQLAVLNDLNGYITHRLADTYRRTQKAKENKNRKGDDQ